MVTSTGIAYSRGAGPHEAEWAIPSPFWAGVAGPDALRRPRILQFVDDRFMETLQARLAAKGGPDLSGLEAAWESHRVLTDDEATVTEPLPRLYQPVHGRFYLVAASLVCHAPGLPDRALELARGEQIAFVLRRVTDDGELAWQSPPGGPRKWVKVPADAAGPPFTVPDEELLPMFPLSFVLDGRRRRILVGLVPTTSGDTWFDASRFDGVVKADTDHEVPKLETGAEAQYQLRCVYRRTACGGVHPDVVSEPTARFTLASYIDLDAPARPVRIDVPVNLDDIKKYRQAIGISLSASFTGKLAKNADKTAFSDDPKTVQPPEPSGAGMWLIALPVVMVCAMMLLWVVLSLIDFFIGWIKWAKTWVPFKAKGR